MDIENFLKSKPSDFRQNDDKTLKHHGVKGMKWGVVRWRIPGGESGRIRNRSSSRPPDRKSSRSFKPVLRPFNFNSRSVQAVYASVAKVRPKEIAYRVRREFTRHPSSDASVTAMVNRDLKNRGLLTTNEDILKSVSREGIKAHKKAVYDNLTSDDISKFKKYTDAAVYSRAVNTYLATGEPKEISKQAKSLKESLSKNTISDTVVYRSTSLNFSTEGVAKKLNKYGAKELESMFDNFENNFKGKSFKENRVYSTSTSPQFSIDDWRKVNPNAAKNYNTYLVINTKGTPGVFADGRTSNGKTLVNTRSNQEAILAPNKMTYRKMAFDKKRNMFAIYLDAE